MRSVSYDLPTQIRETVQGNVEAYGGSEIIREVGTQTSRARRRTTDHPNYEITKSIVFVSPPAASTSITHPIIGRRVLPCPACTHDVHRRVRTPLSKFTVQACSNIGGIARLRRFAENPQSVLFFGAF